MILWTEFWRYINFFIILHYIYLFNTLTGNNIKAMETLKLDKFKKKSTCDLLYWNLFHYLHYASTGRSSYLKEQHLLRNTCANAEKWNKFCKTVIKVKLHYIRNLIICYNTDRHFTAKAFTGYLCWIERLYFSIIEQVPANITALHSHHHQHFQRQGP